MQYPAHCNRVKHGGEEGLAASRQKRPPAFLWRQNILDAQVMDCAVGELESPTQLHP